MPILAAYWRCFARHFRGTIVPRNCRLARARSFKGVVDLITMKAYLGEATAPSEIPADMADAVEEARTQLIEAAAEGDDELIMKYLDGEELTPEEISAGLRKGIAGGNVIPVFCGSAASNVGVRPLMNALVAYLPSPADAPAVTAQKPDGTKYHCRCGPRSVGRVRLEDRCRSVRRQDFYFRVALWHDQGRLAGVEPTERQRRAHQPGLRPARQGTARHAAAGRG